MKDKNIRRRQVPKKGGTKRKTRCPQTRDTPPVGWTNAGSQTSDLSPLPLSLSPPRLLFSKYIVSRVLPNALFGPKFLKFGSKVALIKPPENFVVSPTHRPEYIKLPFPKPAERDGTEGKRLAWMSQDLLVKLKGEKEMHGQWKQGQVSWEEYRDAACLCKDVVKKAKAWLELNLARDTKNNEKGFYR